MKGFIHSIALKITGGSSVTNAADAVGKLDTKVNQVSKSADFASKKLHDMGRSTELASSRGGSALAGFIAKLGIGAAIAKSIGDAYGVERLSTRLAGLQGSAGVAQESMAFLRETSDKLGVSFQASQRGYSELVQGFQRRGMAEHVNEMYTAVAEGSAVWKLTNDEMEGVMSSMAQMAADGSVSANVLIDHIEKKMPGAWDAAVKASGMGARKFMQALDEGRVSSEKFLPKFAAELRSAYGKDVPAAMNSATANMERYRNALSEVSEKLGQELLPYVTKFYKEYVIPGITWLKDNISTVVKWGGVIAGAGIALNVLGTVVTTVTNAAKIFKLVMMGVNLVMIANPIGAVITAIAALAAGFVYLYNKSEIFRAALAAQWSVMRETGRIVVEALIAPYRILGKIIEGIFTLDKSKIKAALDDASAFMQNTVLKAGERIGNAFMEGAAKGRQNFKDSQAARAASKGDAVSNAFADAPASRSGSIPLNTKVKERLDGITGGGRAQKNITINLGKFFEDIVIQTQTVGQGANEISDIVLRRLLQVLNTANQTQ